MSESSGKQDKVPDAEAPKGPRIKGAGNPESHSQDADRHRKREHQKSDK